MSQAAEVAFQVHEQYGHALERQVFREYLQGFGFTRTGCPGDEAVPVHRLQGDFYMRPGQGLPVEHGGADGEGQLPAACLV